MDYKMFQSFEYLAEMVFCRFSLNDGDQFFLMNRSESLVSGMIQVWQSSIYIPIEYPRPEEITTELLMNSYKVQQSFSLCADQDYNKTTPLMFIRTRIPLNEYMLIMGHKPCIKGYLANYFPTAWESSKAEMMRSETIAYVDRDRIRIEKIKTAVMQLVSEKKNKGTKRPNFSEASFAATVKTLAQKNYISLAEMDMYLHSRHELASQLCMTAMGFTSVATDCSFNSVFPNLELTPDMGMKTPDYIIKNGNEFHVIEFAFSDGDPVMAAQRKLDKYNHIVDHINHIMFNPDINARVTLSVVVVCTDRVFIADEYGVCNILKDRELSNDRSYLEPVYRLVQDVENIQNYHHVRTQFDSWDTDEVTIDEVKMIKLRDQLIQCLMRKDMPKKALPLSQARSKEMVGKLECTKKSNLKEITTLKGDFLSDKMFLSASESGLKNIIKRNHKNLEFGPEIKKIISTSPETVQARIREAMVYQCERAKLGLSRPKFLKVPVMSSKYSGVELPRQFREVETLSEGTKLLRGTVHKMEHDPDSELFLPGIGISETMINLFLTTFKSMAVMNQVTKDNFIDRFKETELYDCLVMMEVFARETMLLSHRRFHKSGNKGKHSAFKKYDHFSLIVKNGPRMKRDAQLVMKVLVKTQNLKNFEAISRPFQRINTIDRFADEYSTDWFSIQMADLEHFCTIASRSLVVLSDMWAKMRESEPSAALSQNAGALKELFLVPILIMMEHKRGTSTAAQNTRYLVHSASALASDRMGLVSTLSDLPIRSEMQAYVVKRQLEWFLISTEGPESVLSEPEMTTDKDASNDQLIMRSIFDHSMRVSFGVTMGEMYYGNLFNPKSGFTGMRARAVLAKMFDCTKMYKENLRRDKLWRTTKKIIDDKTMFHSFDVGFVKRAMKMWMDGPNIKKQIQEAELVCLTIGIDTILKLTRTTVAGPTEFTDFLDYSTTVKKDLVFKGLLDLLLKQSDTILMDMASNDEYVAAIFSMFAKDQLGAPREILIQSIRTRVHTAMFNAFFAHLCKMHPDEMITKESKKREIQSRTMLNYRERAQRANESGEKIAGAFSINADSSKWAPSQVMETYMVMISEMDMNEDLKNYFTVILNAYSNKLIFVERTMREKLDKASEERIDSDKVLKETQEFLVDKFVMLFHDGMGQGNFQLPSSFYHVIINDYSLKLIKDIFQDESIHFESRSLISSDDTTIMILIIFKVDSSHDSALLRMRFTLYRMLDMFTAFRKLANVHINWKKTALQRHITEFNSVFNVSKRTYVASVKDCYNSVAVVDMTRPEDAVREALSNVKRLMEAGCYLETINLCLKENRNKVNQWMCMTQEKIMNLCNLLDCEEIDLPYELGFVPLKMPMETLIYGPEVTIWSAKSEKLMSFHEKIHSYNKLSVSDPESWMNNTIDTMAKIMIEVPIRADKQLSELKRFVVSNEDRDELALCGLDNLKETSCRIKYRSYMKKYLLSSRRNYGFSSSFRMHSIVRAMQYSAKVKFSTSVKEFLTLEKSVEEILSIDSYRSYLHLLSHLSSISRNHAVITSKMETLDKKRMNRHPTTRTLCFFRRAQFENVSSQEIVQSLFGHKTNVKSKVMSSITEMSEVLSVNFQHFMENPLSTVIKIFPEDSLNQFKVFVDKFVTLYQLKMVSMVSDFHSSANRETDMLNLYLYKSVPEYVYQDKVTQESMEFVAKSNTMIALASKTELSQFLSNQCASDSDSREAMLIKAYGKAELDNIAGNITDLGRKGVRNFKDREYFYKYPFFNRQRTVVKEAGTRYFRSKWTYIDQSGMLVMTYVRPTEIMITLFGELSDQNKNKGWFDLANEYNCSKDSLTVRFASKKRETKLVDLKTFISADFQWYDRLLSQHSTKMLMFMVKDISKWHIKIRFNNSTFVIWSADIKADPEMMGMTEKGTHLKELNNSQPTLNSVFNFLDKFETMDDHIVPRVADRKGKNEEEKLTDMTLSNNVTSMFMAGNLGAGSSVPGLFPTNIIEVGDEAYNKRAEKARKKKEKAKANPDKDEVEYTDEQKAKLIAMGILRPEIPGVTVNYDYFEMYSTSSDDSETETEDVSMESDEEMSEPKSETVDDASETKSEPDDIQLEEKITSINIGMLEALTSDRTLLNLGLEFEKIQREMDIIEPETMDWTAEVDEDKAVEGDMATGRDLAGYRDIIASMLKEAINHDLSVNLMDLASNSEMPVEVLASMVFTIAKKEIKVNGATINDSFCLMVTGYLMRQVNLKVGIPDPTKIRNFIDVAQMKTRRNTEISMKQDDSWAMQAYFY